MSELPAASFSRDQIAFFRAQFATHIPPEGRGLDEAGFVAAANKSIEHAALVSPGEEALKREFQRLKRNGSITWAVFFQVMQHSRDNARTLGRSSSRHRTPPSRSEQYIAGEEAPQTMDNVANPPTPPIERGFRTLRNGGRAVGNALGRFFGVTEDSQIGNTESVGWAEIAQQSAQTSTFNFIAGGQSERQYADSDNEIEVAQPGVPPQHSFEFLDASSSESEEEQGLFSEAPPEYYAVVDEPPVAGGETQQLTTRASVYTSSTDVPPYIVEQAGQRQQQPPEPARHVEAAARRTASPTQISVTADNMREFIFDPNEAYSYYLTFVKNEARQHRRQGRQGAQGFFGADQTDAQALVVASSNGPTRHDSVRGGRITETGVQLRPRRKRGGRTKLERQSTLIRQKVDSLPTFFPFFILGITLVQSIATIVAIIIGGLAPIQAIPQQKTDEIGSLLDPIRKAVNSSYQESVNPWIGAPIPFLITFGAKFTPCMREDHKINARNARFREQQIEDGKVGCCVNGNWYGSTSISNCAHNYINGTGVTDTEFIPNMMCSKAGYGNLVNFRPCCLSLTGQCQLMLQMDCEQRNGKFHSQVETCQQVNCLSGVCQMGGIPSDSDFPDQAKGNQWWRLFLPLIFHMGVIHLLVIMLIQLYVGIKIERTAGWLRVGLVYFISGIGGNLLSAIFVPYEVQFGASGALFGLLAVVVVELIQSWQIVDRAWWELMKVAVFIIVMFGLGTLPYVDNVAHIGGFVDGILAALIFLPYITFGKFDAWRKRILLIIAIPLLIAIYLVELLVFYLVQNSEFCRDCKYFDCVPYRSGLCENDFTNPDPDVN